MRSGDVRRIVVIVVPANFKLPQASSRVFKRRAVILIDVCILGHGNGLEQLAQTFIWERDIRGAVGEKKNDLQSGSSSWCTKYFNSQVVARSYFVALSLTLVILFAESV